MSTVVGLVTKKCIFLGADSRCSATDGDKRPYNIKKIFTNGDYIIAFVGSIRGAQIFYPERFEPPDHINKFPEAMYKHCETHSCLITDNDGTLVQQCSFLVVWNKMLFEIDTDFSILQIKNFTSIGAGSEYVLGSLYSTEELNIKALDRVKLSLKAADEYSTTTSKPFCIETIS